MKESRKKWLRIFGPVAMLYFGGFMLLWLGGGYLLSASGRTRAWTGMPLPDTLEWQPLFGWCQPEYQWPSIRDDWSGGEIRPRCDSIGWLYYPMWLVVKTRNPPVFLADSKGSIPSEVDVVEGFHVHPLKGKSLRNSFEIEETSAGPRLRYLPD